MQAPRRINRTYTHRPWRVFAMLAALIASHQTMAATECGLYIGTYTKPGGSAGIYYVLLDTETGALTLRGLAARSTNPAFLAMNTSRTRLYAVNEIGAGSVSAFVIGPGGKLMLLNQQPARGNGPCHLSVDPTGKHVLVANYGSGSVATFSILADGSLGESLGFAAHTGSGPHPSRQRSSHAHSIYAFGDLVYVCDLGTDEVRVYQLDPAAGTLTPAEPAIIKLPPGAGPRHLAFHGNVVYVLNELSNTISTFAREPTSGTLTPLHVTPTLPAGFTNQSTVAEIDVHPNGRFLYASNRGHDSLAVFTIAADGGLTLAEHVATGGRTPRSFAIDPSGRWLVVANQDSGNLVVFQIDPNSGGLTHTGHTAAIAEPVCVCVAP